MTNHKQIIIFTILLSALSLLGNAASLRLFYGIDFIFGSIAVMYAAMAFGRVSCAIVAIIGSAYTFNLWGHPYAIIIFTLEAIWFSTFWSQGKKNTVLVDTGYWLFIGVPLVLIFYVGFIGLKSEAAGIIALKQTLNGVFNALVANYIYYVTHVLWKKQERISIEALLFNIIIIITLLAGTIPAIISTNQTSTNLEHQVDKQLEAIARKTTQTLPSVNTKSTVSEFINSLSLPDDTAIAIIDKENKIIGRQGEIESHDPSPDSNVVTRKNGIKIWLPGTPTSILKQWRAGRYVKQVVVNDSNYFNSIIIEQKTKNVVNKIGQLRIELFITLALLLCTAIVLAFIVSRWLTIPINNLDKASLDFIKRITSGASVPFPKSNVLEFYSLSKSLSSMTSTISSHYKDLSTKKEYLEDVVDKNTDIMKRLSIVASRTTNSVVITDVHGYIEWVNNAFIKLTGYSFETAVGKKPGELLQGSETNPKTVKQISKKIALSQGFSEDIVNYTKDNVPYWVHIDCDPIEENGSVVGFIAIESDITLRKITEQDLRKRTTELNAVLDAATEISIVTTSPDGIITMFNAGAEKMLGYSSEEMVNKQSPAIIHLPSEVELRSLELSKELRSKIEGFRVFVTIPELKGSETREWTYVKKDGTHIIVQLSVTFMQSSNGEIIGYLGVAQDITERKKLEKLKNEFISTVNHELRTPLTSIGGTLKLINGGVAGEVSDKVKELIEIASRNTEQLNFLINDLLDMDKIASGQMVFHLETQPLMHIIEQSLISNQSYAKQYDVTLNLKQSVNDIMVNVDPDRLYQVLSNLLSNAAKFSHHGGIVDISTEVVDNEYIKISVQDYGIGIDETFQDQLFNKFSQEDNSDTRSKGGTGLGLAISRELINSMNGRVGFESIKNKGSVFWFELPILQEPATKILSQK